jgi:hypothetical protein
MAITSKPKPTVKAATAPDVNALIEKGGSPPKASPDKEKKTHNVMLYLPPDTVEAIDALLGKRKIKASRHTWFLEAIYEKLEREQP